MYQGGVGARQEAEQRQAAAAAGTMAPGPSSTAPPGQAPDRATAAAALPAFYSEDTPASANEMWQRLHADPLFAIKQQEVSTRRNILTNPVQMQAIKAQIKQLKGGEDDDRGRRHKDKKEKKRKRDKKDKKDKESKRHRRSPVSSDDNEDSDRSPSYRAGVAVPREAGKKESLQMRLEEREEERGRGRRRSQERVTEKEERRKERIDYRDAWEESPPRHRKNGPSSRRNRSRSKSRERSRSRDRRNTRERSRYRSRSPDHRMKGSRDNRGGGGGGDRQGRRDDDHRSCDYDRDDHRSRDYDRSRRGGDRDHGGDDRGGNRDESRHQRSRSKSRSPSRPPPRDSQRDRDVKDSREGRKQENDTRPQKVHLDGASAQGAGAQYGITFGRQVPDAVRHQDRSDLAEATRKRLEDAARKKEAEERDAAEARRQRQRRDHHRPGRLTEEERQRRLAEMTAAADEHDAQRHARIKEYEKLEAKEGKGNAQAFFQLKAFLFNYEIKLLLLVVIGSSCILSMYFLITFL